MRGALLPSVIHTVTDCRGAGEDFDWSADAAANGTETTVAVRSAARDRLITRLTLTVEVSLADVMQIPGTGPINFPEDFVSTGPEQSVLISLLPLSWKCVGFAVCKWSPPWGRDCAPA